jgi:hypothetical protein
MVAGKMAREEVYEPAAGSAIDEAAEPDVGSQLAASGDSMTDERFADGDSTVRLPEDPSAAEPADSSLRSDLAAGRGGLSNRPPSGPPGADATRRTCSRVVVDRTRGGEAGASDAKPDCAAEAWPLAAV